jgi:hypothetical protein
MDERTESRVLYLAAVALALFGIFAPYKWHEMPNWITNSALFLALFLALWAVGLSLPARAKRIKKLLAAFLIAGGITALVSGLVLYLDKSPSEPPTTLAPDVTLRFIYPDRPALLLINNSDKVAKQIKWTVVLWNLDDPRAFSNNPHPPDVHEPFPIPVSTFDFIPAHSTGGPQGLLGTPIASYIRSGNRLVGTASVNCADCDRGHSYVISTIVDQGGWFSEIDLKNGDLVIPPKLTKQSVIEYAKAIEAVPTDKRISITAR